VTVLAVVPARGGSQGLKRKNLLPDANGVPLVLVSARAARDAGCTVIVSTDDPEVRSLAELDGHQVHVRGHGFADVPVDDVVACAAKDWQGPVLLVQPTVQPMTADLLKWFLEQTDDEPLALGVQDRHILWHDGTALTGRVERQQEARWPIREMGVRWWPALPLAPPVRVATAPRLLVDIDTADDYHSLGLRMFIQFIVMANHRVGSGHLHRALTLAEGLQRHDLHIQLYDSDGWAQDMVDERGWERPPLTPNVVVYDRLDLTHRLPWGPSVALENQSGHATATVNAMYGHGDYVGPDYAVVRPEFLVKPFTVKEDATKVLALFGGTDPARLTDLAREALPDVELDVVRPADKRGVAAAMHQADLLLTSGGRTVFEAAAVGIPTIVLCQNMRELTHTQLGVGNLPMGLGRLVDPFHLRRTVKTVLDDYDLRLDLSETARGSVDGLGASRVRRIIEHVGYYGERP
jgi:spore coat polysaccharide biosynthesis predicted glycosyltransferase SpsG